ncbi:leucine-rich alpha-2-glycoprotein [Carettochelys insculpta]|uniref:leucine-rich alpha-2-glycoprotein n=1 Tax=Carettochelys insculpta TaxID=44489 RepID=UPI003EB6F850
MGRSELALLAALVSSLPCWLGAPCPPVPTSSNITQFVCTFVNLSSFPTGFHRKTWMISVEFTNLSSISPEALQDLQKLPQLRELHLSSNRLRSLPGGLFQHLPGLRVLDLTNNLLEDLPPEISGSYSPLQHLVLNGNRLRALEAAWFQTLVGLEWLDVSNNQLEDLPPNCFHNLSNLTSLDLSHNLLARLTPEMLAGLTSLERLNLEGNQLHTIAEHTFDAVPHLQYLFLQSNNLSSLPAELFRGLGQLALLDLSNNSLTSLAPCFSERNLTLELDLSGNPWACDCAMLSFVQWAMGHSVGLFAKQHTLCASPQSLQGQLLATVTKESFAVSCSAGPAEPLSPCRPLPGHAA